MNFILIQIVIFCLIIEISSFTGVFTNFRRRSRKHIDQRIIKGSSELPSHLPSTFEQDEDNINYLAHKHKATLRLVRNNPFLTPRDNKKLERFSSGIIHEKELETGLDVINSLDLLKDLNFTIFNATQRPVLDKLVTTFFLQRKQEHLILKFMATLNRLKYTYKFMNENHKENMLRLFQHIPYPTLFPISYAEMVFLMSNLQIPWKFVSEGSKKTILLTMHELQSLFDQIDRISIIFHYGKLEIPLAEEQPWRRAASTYSTQQSNSQQSNLLSNMSEKERNEVFLSFLGLITKSVSNLEGEPILENQARSISNIIYGLAYTGFRKTDFPREFNEKLLQFVEVTWDRMTFAGQCMTLFGLARMHQNWFQFPKSLQMKFEATFLKELPQTDFESFTMFLKTFSQLRYSWTQNPLLSEQIYARIGKYYCSHQSSSSSSLSCNSIQAQTTVNPLFMSDFLSYLDLSKQQNSFYKSKENYKFLLQSGKLNRYRDHPWFLLPNNLQQTILASLTGNLFDSNIHRKSGNRDVLAFKKKDSPFDKLLLSPMEQSTDQQNVTTVTTTTTTRTTTTAVEVAKITTTTTTTTTTTISSPIFATNPVDHDQENPNNLAVGHFQNLKAIWPLLPITVQEQFIQQIKQLKAFPALSGNQLGKFFDELLSFKISWRFLTKEFQESVFQSIYKYDSDLFPGYIGRILTAFANLGATGKDIPKEILECFSQSLENKKSLCQNSGFRQIIQGFFMLGCKWDDIPDRIRNILPELSKSLKNNCTADDLSYCMHGLAVLSFDSKELKESHSNSWKNSSLMALHQIIIENAFDCFPSNSTTKPLSEVALEVLSRWKGYFELIYSLPESIQEYLFHSINNNHLNISNAAKIIQLIENALYETPQSTTTHPDYFSFYRRNSRRINDDDADEDQREQEEFYLSRLLRPPPRPRLTQRHLNTERFRVSRTHEQFSNYLQSFLNFIHNQRQQPPPPPQQEEEDEGRELFLARSPRRKQKDRHSHKYPPPTATPTTTRKWFGMKNEFLGFSNYFYPMDIAVFFDPPPPPSSPSCSFSSSFDQNKSYYRNPLRKLVAFIEINGDSHYLKQTQDEEEDTGQQQPQQPQQQKRGEELLRRVDYFKEYLYSIYYPSIPLIRIDVKDLAFPRDFPEFSESSLSLFSFFLDEKEMKLKELCQGIYETILNKSLSSQYDQEQQQR